MLFVQAENLWGLNVICDEYVKLDTKKWFAIIHIMLRLYEGSEKLTIETFTGIGMSFM